MHFWEAFFSVEKSQKVGKIAYFWRVKRYFEVGGLEALKPNSAENTSQQLYKTIYICASTVRTMYDAINCKSVEYA